MRWHGSGSQPVGRTPPPARSAAREGAGAVPESLLCDALDELLHAVVQALARLGGARLNVPGAVAQGVERERLRHLRRA